MLTLQLRRIQHGPHIGTPSNDGKNYTEFTKAFLKIQKRLGITEDDLKEAMSVIMRLNPKPGGGALRELRIQYFCQILLFLPKTGKLEIVLNSKNAPDLRISRSFSDMLNAYHPVVSKIKLQRNGMTFKQKLDSANGLSTQFTNVSRRY
jgi:RNA polymerase sigma-54 factor